MELDENSLLATMNPLILLGAVAAVLVIGYFCAWKYKNTNDFAQSVRLYFPLIIIADIIMIMTGIPIIILLALDIMGFVVMALFSNHFF